MISSNAVFENWLPVSFSLGGAREQQTTEVSSGSVLANWLIGTQLTTTTTQSTTYKGILEAKR